VRRQRRDRRHETKVISGYKFQVSGFATRLQSSGGISIAPLLQHEDQEQRPDFRGLAQMFSFQSTASPLRAKQRLCFNRIRLATALSAHILSTNKMPPLRGCCSCCSPPVYSVVAPFRPLSPSPPRSFRLKRVLSVRC
jgi:hypothetical protein